MKNNSVGKKLNKKDLLSTNLSTKKGYCTQRMACSIFCRTFFHKQMKLNKYPYRMKIDEETKKYIDFLRKNKIKVPRIIRESIKEPLKNKCIELKIKINEEIIHF